MSKERQRRRAALEAERARPGAKGGSRPAAKGGSSAGGSRKVPAGAAKKGKPPVYRQRRFPPLPWKLKLALAVGWLVAAVLILVFVPTWTARIGFLVIATMLLPLIVVLVRDPSRRTR